MLAGSAAGSPRVYVWDVDNTHRILDLKVEESNNNIWSIAFSADSKMLATPHFDNTVKLWELPSGNSRGTLPGHIQAVYGVAFSPDGKTLATGSDDRKVKLWNLATLQEMATLGPLTGGCRSLEFSPDGSILAVGHYVDPHPYTWLWMAPSFDEIDALEAKEKSPEQAAIAPAVDIRVHPENRKSLDWPAAGNSPLPPLGAKVTSAVPNHPPPHFVIRTS
jgi:WD40 repeat protein